MHKKTMTWLPHVATCCHKVVAASMSSRTNWFMTPSWWMVETVLWPLDTSEVVQEMITTQAFSGFLHFGYCVWRYQNRLNWTWMKITAILYNLELYFFIFFLVFSGSVVFDQFWRSLIQAMLLNYDLIQCDSSTLLSTDAWEQKVPPTLYHLLPFFFIWKFKAFSDVFRMDLPWLSGHLCPSCTQRFWLICWWSLGFGTASPRSSAAVCAFFASIRWLERTVHAPLSIGFCWNSTTIIWVWNLIQQDQVISSKWPSKICIFCLVGNGLKNIAMRLDFASGSLGMNQCV